jgi:hypothetical protein
VTARGDVASSQAPLWPKNRLRIRPTDMRLVGGPISAETRQRLSEAVLGRIWRPRLGLRPSAIAPVSDWASRESRAASNESSGVEPITGSGASVMRHWALRLGREARPCIRSRERRGARGEPAGESNGRAANPGPPPQSNRDGASVRIKERKGPRLRTPKVVRLSVV